MYIANKRVNYGHETSMPASFLPHYTNSHLIGFSFLIISEVFDARSNARSRNLFITLQQGTRQHSMNTDRCIDIEHCLGLLNRSYTWMNRYIIWGRGRSAVRGPRYILYLWYCIYKMGTHTSALLETFEWLARPPPSELFELLSRGHFYELHLGGLSFHPTQPDSQSHRMTLQGD